MNRSGLLLSAALGIIGVARILFPNQLLQLFSLDPLIAIISLVTAFIALGVWYGPLNFLSGSVFVRFMGLAVFIAGLAAIYSPTLLGSRQTYLPIADIFLFLESGVVLQLIGLERKAANALSPLMVIGILGTIVARRFHRQPLTPTAISTN